MQNPISILLALSLFGLLALPATASAQVGPDEANPFQRGRELYNSEQYAQAIPYLVEAAQREPSRGDLYLALARSAHWANNFDLAVFYYDIYLGRFADRAELTAPPRDRKDKIAQERDSANKGRKNPSAPAKGPEAQETIRTALLAKLEDGVALTNSGGGAHALFQSLLRAGFARPEITDLRNKVRAALLEEALLFAPAKARSMPALSLQEWQTQKERLTLWQELGAKTTAAPREGDAKRVAAALDTAEGQSAYLNEDYERAFGAFKRAHARDEAYLPATFGLLNALYRQPSGIAGWEKVLEDAKKSVGADASLGAFLPVYRAAFLSRAGERDKAAAMLGEVLGIAAER